MERLSKNLCLEIFRLLDCTSLAAAAHESGGDWHPMMNCGPNYLRKDGEATVLHLMPRGVPNPGRTFMQCMTDVICLTERNHWMLKLIRKGGDYYVIRGDYIHKYVPSGEGSKLTPGFGDRKKIDSASLVEDE